MLIDEARVPPTTDLATALLSIFAANAHLFPN